MLFIHTITDITILYYVAITINFNQYFRRLFQINKNHILLFKNIYCIYLVIHL